MNPFGPCDTYAQYRAKVNALDLAMNANAEAWKAFEEAKAAELGIAPKGAMNLTPDAIKMTPEWQRFFRSNQIMFTQLRELNKNNAKQFRKEAAAEREAKRAAAIAKQA